MASLPTKSLFPSQGKMPQAEGVRAKKNIQN